MLSFSGMKPTDKTADALQAMLAFLALATDGLYSYRGEPAADVGLNAFYTITSLYRGDPRMLALRDLVQAAADERAASALPAAPSGDDTARAIRFADIKERSASVFAYLLPEDRGAADDDRAWLIDEVQRLRHAARNIDKQ